MKKKRISRRIILALLILNILSTNAFSQLSYTVGADDVSDFVNTLFCDFDDQINIPASKIETHLQDLLVRANSVDGTPEVILNSASSTEASFTWPQIEGAASYSTSFLGLNDGSATSQQALVPEVSFSNLSPQLGLFTFSSSGTGFTSILQVIIVDMDAFHLPETNYECLCHQTPNQIDHVSDCGNNTHLFFPWVNTCYTNKYHFEISDDNSNYSEDFYCLYRTDTVFVLSHCNPDVPNSLGDLYFGDYDYFQVIFTHLGVHFYLKNPNSLQLTVYGNICDCYNIDSGPTENPGGSRNTDEDIMLPLASEFLVSPNPFNQEIQLSLPIIGNQEVMILLYDLSGRIVQQLSLLSADGNLLIPTDQLATGVYQIHVSTKTQSWQQRILKLE